LNTTRALISLIDQTNQYILIEATQKSRLLFDSLHNDEDGILFGRTTLPRSLGLCGNALEMLSPHEASVRQKSWRLSPLIINDLTQDDEFKDKPFATSHPSLRFYAAMPISTKSGFNIGTLSVMDVRPREGLNDVEIKFLGDLAVTIMAHLEMTRSNEGHRRSEKMIKGLGGFMEGRADLDDWWLELGNNNPRGRQHGPKESVEAESNKRGEPDLDPTLVFKRNISPERTMEAEVPEPSPSLGGRSEPSIATPAKAKADCAIEVSSISTTQGDSDVLHAASKSGGPESRSHGSSKSTLSEMIASAHVTSRTPSRGHSARTFTPDYQESLISKRLKEMFSRASNIIQESIEVDGAIFLDASVSMVSGQTGEPLEAQGLLN
jgi:hypothetical protein